MYLSTKKYGSYMVERPMNRLIEMVIHGIA